MIFRHVIIESANVQINTILVGKPEDTQATSVPFYGMKILLLANMIH